MKDKPIDAFATAANLRRWAKTLQIPSGPFVNDDLRDAADMLDNYAHYLMTFSTASPPHIPQGCEASETEHD